MSSASSGCTKGDVCGTSSQGFNTRELSPKHVAGVPIQVFAGRCQLAPGRYRNLPLEVVVLVTVFEFLLDPVARLESKFGRDGDVSLVEERMDVASKQQPVARIVRSFPLVGSNVRGLEHWQRPLARHGAATIVEIRHEHPEAP